MVRSRSAVQFCSSAQALAGRHGKEEVGGPILPLGSLENFLINKFIISNS